MNNWILRYSLNRLYKKWQKGTLGNYDQMKKYGLVDVIVNEHTFEPMFVLKPPKEFKDK